MNETSQAALYGRGVFTTIAVFGRELFLWDKHWRRLTRNAKVAGIDLDAFSEARVRTAAQEAIERERVVDGRLRVTFYDNRWSDIWPDSYRCDGNTYMSILAGPRRAVAHRFRCFVSSHILVSRSPLAGVKSCNYLDNILAIEEARERGFEEAVRINEFGHLAGACLANLFWSKDRRLFTPSLLTGALPGTTREFVLENTECEEVEAGIGEMEGADLVFLTSAGLGVVGVDEFNGRALSESDHPILHLIPGTN